MKTEELEKLGIEADVIKKVLKLHGKSIEVKKAALATAELGMKNSQDEINDLKSQLTKAGETISDFKKLDPEAIKKSAEDWEAKADEYKTQAEKAATDAKDAMAKVKFDHDLDGLMDKAGVVNKKAFRALLDYDTIVHKDDGSFVGFDEQIEALRKSDENQFTPDKDTPRIVDGTKPTTVIKSDDADLATALKFANVSEVKEK